MRRRTVITLVALICGCAPAAPLRSVYQVQIPTLTAPPSASSCIVNGEPARCLLVYEEDWRALVIELKSACLALGGSLTDCQVE